MRSLLHLKFREFTMHGTGCNGTTTIFPEGILKNLLQHSNISSLQRGCKRCNQNMMSEQTAHSSKKSLNWPDEFQDSFYTHVGSLAQKDAQCQQQWLRSVLHLFCWSPCQHRARGVPKHKMLPFTQLEKECFGA